MKKWALIGISGVLAGTLSVAALAQTHSPQDEIMTAHAHALMASTADTVQIGHKHMQHVINCLVGPKGNGFDADAGTPCKGLGNGAIPDAKGDAKLQASLKSALADVQAGLAAYELHAIHRAGYQAASVLATDIPPIPASPSGSR